MNFGENNFWIEAVPLQIYIKSYDAIATTVMSVAKSSYVHMILKPLFRTSSTLRVSPKQLKIKPLIFQAIEPGSKPNHFLKIRQIFRIFTKSLI